MALSRKFLTVGAIGVAAFALIGTGATAAYQDSLSSVQTIKTGTLNMGITGDGEINSSGKSVTWSSPVGGFGSTFSTTHRETITNLGSLAPTKMTLTTFSGVGSTGPVGSPAYIANNGLLQKTNVTVDAYAPGTTTNPVFHYSGLLQSMPQTQTIDGTIPVGASFDAVVTFSATDLPNDTQNGSIAAIFSIAFEN